VWANFPEPRHGPSPCHHLGPAAWLTELIAASGSGTDGCQWQCPAHADATPSLSVAESATSAALIHCRAGCGTTAVLTALHLGPRHLYQPPAIAPADWLTLAGVHISYPPLVLARAADPTERLDAVHHYGADYKLERWRSAAGHKRLVWFRRDSSGCWIPGLGGIPVSELPLYRETDVRIVAATGDTLHLVESESSVDALNNAGHYATTWAGGASTPPLAKLADALADVPDVRVIADHDEPGIHCAHAILAAVPHATGWLPPRPGHDVRDLLSTDRTLATLRPIPEGSPA
jgi:hypothetical protein